MQTIYFSERLLCQLERLHTVPLTLVEAKNNRPEACPQRCAVWGIALA